MTDAADRCTVIDGAGNQCIWPQMHVVNHLFRSDTEPTPDQKETTMHLQSIHDRLSDHDGATVFDFHDAPSLDGTSMGFGGKIRQIDDATWRLTWNDGVVNEWSEDLPTWHAAHAYLGHLIDHVFRGATFEQDIDEWLILNWFPRATAWARWHYRDLIARLTEAGIDRDDIDVEDMGGGSWALLIQLSEDRFAWIDDEEDLDGQLRCYLYRSLGGGIISDSEDGDIVTVEGAIAYATRWARLPEADAVGAVLAQVEDFDLPARQRILREAAHQVNVMIRENRSN